MSYDVQASIRAKNDLVHDDDWANNQVSKMSFERMLGYVYSPNSSTLEKAIREQLKKEREELLDVLLETRRLVSEGAMEGFRPLVGTWANELFLNNAALTAAIKKLENK